MWDQWKHLETWPKLGLYIVLWARRPNNRTPEAHILHTSKSSSNGHVDNNCWGNSGNIFRKSLKTGVFTYFGAQNDMKNEPPEVCTPLHLQRAYKAILLWNQWKRFVKMTDDQNFNLFWGQPLPKNWTNEVLISNISKCSSSQLGIQLQCESSVNFLKKKSKTWSLTCFRAQNY